MLKASDLKGLPIVSDVGGQTGYRAVNPMLDIHRMAVTHILIRADKNGQASPAYKLPLALVGRVDSKAIRVADFNIGSLSQAGDGQASKSTDSVNLLEMKVISRKGNFLGMVYDYYFDKPSGQLILFSLLREGEEVFIPCDEDFKAGEEVIISDLSKRIEALEGDKLLPKPVLRAKPAPGLLHPPVQEVPKSEDGQAALPVKEAHAEAQKTEPLQAEEAVGEEERQEAERLVPDKIRLSSSAKNLLRRYWEA